MSSKGILFSNNRTIYRWAPFRSTPSCQQPFCELPSLVDTLHQLGVRQVADFGAGRGRNAPQLVKTFNKVYLLEVPENTECLHRLKAKQKWKNCRVLADAELASVTPSVDAVMLFNVLHTLPGPKLRNDVLKRCKKLIHTDGRIVIVTPKHDPAYRHVDHRPSFADGFVMLHPDNTFSFYRNYTAKEFMEFLAAQGLVCEVTLPSHARRILITRVAH